MQLLRWKIAQKLLKRTEADGTLVKVLVRLGLLEADATLNKVICAPVLFLRMQIACAVSRLDQRQNAARVFCFCVQKVCDGCNIFHQASHIAERMMIDFLQDIASAAGRHSQICLVDMAAAIRHAGNRLRVQAETAQDLEQRFVHAITPFHPFCFILSSPTPEDNRFPRFVQNLIKFRQNLKK